MTPATIISDLPTNITAVDGLKTWYTYIDGLFL